VAALNGVTRSDSECSGGLLPPPPPAEKTTARQDQTRKSGACDGTGDRCGTTSTDNLHSRNGRIVLDVLITSSEILPTHNFVYVTKLPRNWQPEWKSTWR
jgi:hypothetical protein